MKADEKGPQHLSQVVVWVILLCIYLSSHKFTIDNLKMEGVDSLDPLKDTTIADQRLRRSFDTDGQTSTIVNLSLLVDLHHQS